MPKSYRKKPVVIQAIQFTGRNDDEIAAFVGDQGYDPIDRGPSWVIHTLEGDMRAAPGDYIICGIGGEFYPCKPDIFEKTYEEVTSCGATYQHDLRCKLPYGHEGAHGG